MCNKCKRYNRSVQKMATTKLVINGNKMVDDCRNYEQSDPSFIVRPSAQLSSRTGFLIWKNCGARSFQRFGSANKQRQCENFVGTAKTARPVGRKEEGRWLAFKR